jgi:hypothetical protein
VSSYEADVSHVYFAVIIDVRVCISARHSELSLWTKREEVRKKLALGCAHEGHIVAKWNACEFDFYRSRLYDSRRVVY